MRNFPLICIFFIYTVQATAQRLTLVPEVGVQFPKSKLEYATFPGINNHFRHLAPTLGFRLHLEGKRGHGPYFGAGYGLYGQSYELYLPSAAGPNAYDHHKSSAYEEAIRTEIGYQWNSKPVYFKKVWDNRLDHDEFAALPQKGWSVRLQPRVGIAWQGIIDNGGGWTEYTLSNSVIREEDIPRSNNGNFVLLGGLGFEFSKNDKRRLTLSFNCVHGFGQSVSRLKLDISTPSGDYNGLLGSKGNGFSVTIGIPIMLWRKK